MIGHLLNSLSLFINREQTHEYGFTEMREETGQINPIVIELRDLSEEAQRERMDSQINKAAKKLIPSTEIVEGCSDKSLQNESHAYYDLGVIGGDIHLEKTSDPTHSECYFSVNSQNDCKLLPSCRVWSYRSKIVSVDLTTLDEESPLRDTALEILNAARAILEHAEGESVLKENEIELKGIN